MSDSKSTYPKPRALAIVTGLCGAGLLWLGIILLQLGGSFYYAAAGVMLLTVAVLVFRGDHRGALLYGAFLVVTYLWSFYEVGLAAGRWHPGSPSTVLGLWFLLPRVRRGLWQGPTQPLWQQRPAQISAGAFAVFIVAVFIANTGYEVGTPSALGPAGEATPLASGVTMALKTGTRYAAADRINVENVEQLERAWEIRTGVSGEFKGTPIQVGDGLYLCTGRNIMLSLDPDTGEERWRYDPQIESPMFGFWDTCRGVTHYALPDTSNSSDCPERYLPPPPMHGWLR